MIVRTALLIAAQKNRSRVRGVARGLAKQAFSCPELFWSILMTHMARLWSWHTVVFAAFVAAIAFMSAHFSPASAQRGGEDEWVLLGEQRVQFPGDRDRIRLSKRDGRFDAIALRVRGGDIKIFSLRVTYGNGRTEELAFNEVIRSNDRTRPILLTGEGRFLQEIDLRYGAPPTALLRQPEVQIFGRVADDRRGGGRGDDDFFNREGKRASCDMYAQIAVVQSETASKYRCGLRGPEWNTNAREHFQWCLRAPRQRLLADVRSRYEALGNCFDRLGDEDYEVWDRRGRR
jgi:hypothetical protein